MHVAVVTLAVVSLLLPMMIAKETSVFPEMADVCDKYNTTALRRSQEKEADDDELFYIQKQTWTFVTLAVTVLLNMVYVAMIPAVSLKKLDSQIMDEKCEPPPVGSFPDASLTACRLSLSVCL
jgi:hypothetical protein